AGDTVTAAEFLDGIAPLLQATLNVVRPADPRLFSREQFAATLSLDARETSLRVPRDAAAPGTRQIAAQAERIGAGIVDLVDGVLDRITADPIPLPGGPVAIRSTCDNHLWTLDVTELLTDPVPMQLYNEFLHQVILLRDALLPFTNWESVRLPVDDRGLRTIEPAREAFLTELLVRSTRHSAIVSYARSVLTGSPSDRAYGFDYADARVLPAAATAPLDAAPTHLLTWHPGGAAAPGSGAPVDLVPAIADYYEADRSPLGEAAGERGRGGDLSGATARLVEGRATVERTRTLTIEVTDGVRTATVDLGDALRGHRFAAVAPGGFDASIEAAEQVQVERALDPWRLLADTGLGWAESGTWAIDVRGATDLTVLAVLGTLYPENLVLTEDRTPGTPVNAGKRGPARILIDR
ncbi:MAG: hypothetical protein AAGC46_03325, partial [Solirubrobacteraceae bacterium]